MATKHPYRYLNRGKPGLFASRLVAELEKAQKKAPAKQWIPFIKGLSTKGVKGLEIEDSGIIPYLETLPPEGSITRESLVEWIGKHTSTIKELDLSRSVYGSFHQPLSAGETYQETLYLLNSERDNIDDRLAEIRFDLEELDFDIDLLASDPTIALRLYNEQQELIKSRDGAAGVRFGHWTDVKDPDTGKVVSNMIAHARTSRRGDLFFIEEIQSDWAQRGRRDEWNRIPKGPWVTNTESWSALVLRRLLQRAALDPNFKHVAWITGAMSNGGNSTGRENHNSGLNDFYLKILPKIADKLLSGTGEKVKFMSVNFGGTRVIDVPSIEITDKVREKMMQAQPLYSRDLIQSANLALSDNDYAAYRRELLKAHEMLGSGVHIRLATKVIDAASGDEVAAQQVGHLIEVSLSARNPAMALSHESWHYAYSHLLSLEDKQIVDRAFTDGTRLNSMVREALVRDHASPAALVQCDSEVEAAAHGFSLWMAGKLSISPEIEQSQENVGSDGVDRTVGKVFRKVEKAFSSLSVWVRRVLGETPNQKVERQVSEVFDKLRAGSLRMAEITPIDAYIDAHLPTAASPRPRA